MGQVGGKVAVITGGAKGIQRLARHRTISPAPVQLARGDAPITKAR
jgi:hypothetical protein